MVSLSSGTMISQRPAARCCSIYFPKWSSEMRDLSILRLESSPVFSPRIASACKIFQRAKGISSRIPSVMSSSILYAFFTVLSLNATSEFLQRFLTRLTETRWSSRAKLCLPIAPRRDVVIVCMASVDHVRIDSRPCKVAAPKGPAFVS